MKSIKYDSVISMLIFCFQVLLGIEFISTLRLLFFMLQIQSIPGGSTMHKDILKMVSFHGNYEVYQIYAACLISLTICISLFAFFYYLYKMVTQLNKGVSESTKYFLQRAILWYGVYIFLFVISMITYKQDAKRLVSLFFTYSWTEGVMNVIIVLILVIFYILVDYEFNRKDSTK